jgi:cob(I)alamin adenosyltransferase
VIGKQKTEIGGELWHGATVCGRPVSIIRLFKENYRERPRNAETERKGNRLSKIVTRTGDAGTTGLGDGSRTTKDSLRIDAIGEVDELNSSLGLLLCEELPDAVRAALLDVQNDLFDLGGELCLPGMES